ncbi:hypothetical protein [Cohaesibacter sp. ES.047]|uniref:hypothetical protein n=1 Tax=Cohaesibacter sp. ES.047 TaxID=1798205 RepID=UPI000BB8AA3A|nr:hypothetical protein [Cohaesibacter sp. ES.047]
MKREGFDIARSTVERLMRSISLQGIICQVKSDAGSSEFEVMTFLGHRSPQEARKYVRATRLRITQTELALLTRIDRHSFYR